MKLGYAIVYVPHVTAALEFYERAFGLARRRAVAAGAERVQDAKTKPWARSSATCAI